MGDQWSENLDLRRRYLAVVRRAHQNRLQCCQARRHQFLAPADGSPGVETRPIKLIAGASPFARPTNDAEAEKRDLLGKRNDGWSVVKRLLQHEASQTGARPTSNKTATAAGSGQRLVRNRSRWSLGGQGLRSRIVDHLIHEGAWANDFANFGRRGNPEVSAAASILKILPRECLKIGRSCCEIMGHQGIGWEGEAFSEDELENVRGWLSGKAISIYSGSYDPEQHYCEKYPRPSRDQKG